MGKSSKSAPTPQIQQDSGMNTELMMGLVEAMSMMAMKSEPPAAAAQPQVPQIQRLPEVDYTEKMAQLANKARAGFTTDSAKKKGAGNTSFTSPLLDEEDPVTTGSLLVGDKK